MSTLFSRQCEYALQAVLHLAGRPAGERTSIKELTARLGLPYHFLAKILQQLTHTGLLSSQKGPTGGFALALPAGKITLLQVVEAVDGTALFTSCVLGLPECGGVNPCPVHDRWGTVREEIRTMMSSKTIEELASGRGAPGRRRPDVR